MVVIRKIMFSYPFFSFPQKNYGSNHYGYNCYINPNDIQNTNIKDNSSKKDNKIFENSSKSGTDKIPVMLEILGLKLYFDDILIISILFFLYQEGIRDDELFICLILLLLT